MGRTVRRGPGADRSPVVVGRQVSGRARGVRGGSGGLTPTPYVVVSGQQWGSRKLATRVCQPLPFGAWAAPAFAPDDTVNRWMGSIAQDDRERLAGLAALPVGWDSKAFPCPPDADTAGELIGRNVFDGQVYLPCAMLKRAAVRRRRSTPRRPGC